MSAHQPTVVALTLRRRTTSPTVPAIGCDRESYGRRNSVRSDTISGTSSTPPRCRSRHAESAHSLARSSRRQNQRAQKNRRCMILCQVLVKVGPVATCLKSAAKNRIIRPVIYSPESRGHARYQSYVRTIRLRNGRRTTTDNTDGTAHATPSVKSQSSGFARSKARLVA